MGAAEFTRHAWVPCSILQLHPKTRSLYQSKDTAHPTASESLLCCRADGLNSTSPLQFKSTEEVWATGATTATKMSVVHLGQTPDAVTKAQLSSASAESWARAGIQEAEPWHRGFSRKGRWCQGSIPLLEGPRFGSLPTSLGSSLLSQLTQKSPHLTGRFRVRGSKQHINFSIYRQAVTLCKMSNMEKSNMGLLKVPQYKVWMCATYD